MPIRKSKTGGRFSMSCKPKHAGNEPLMSQKCNKRRGVQFFFFMDHKPKYHKITLECFIGQLNNFLPHHPLELDGRIVCDGVCITFQ